MACRRFSTRRAVAATVLAVLIVAVCAVPGVGAGSAGATRFQRPDPETVRSEARDILSDGRFAPRVSLLDRFFQWLKEKLAWLKLPKLWRTSIGVVPDWVLMLIGGAIVLLLLTVLARRLVLYTRGERAGGFRAGRARFERAADRSFAALCRMMRELAEQGRYRDAIGVMMNALLRRLDEAEVVRFHDSKTNGDYVAEFPAQHAAHGEFRQFALAFDGTIYAGSPCGQGTYHQMNDMFERVVRHATAGS